MNENLRPYDEMKRMFVDEAMTFREIADKIGVEDMSTVWRAMRRGAEKAGDTWPLTRRKKRVPDLGAVKAELMVLEIKEFCSTYGWTYKDFALAINTHPSWVYNLVSGRRTAVLPASVDKVMKFIVAEEEREAS